MTKKLFDGMHSSFTASLTARTYLHGATSLPNVEIYKAKHRYSATRNLPYANMTDTRLLVQRDMAASTKSSQSIRMDSLSTNTISNSSQSGILRNRGRLNETRDRSNFNLCNSFYFYLLCIKIKNFYLKYQFVKLMH